MTKRTNLEAKARSDEVGVCNPAGHMEVGPGYPQGPTAFLTTGEAGAGEALVSLRLKSQRERESVMLGDLAWVPLPL